ncbi:transcriptional regulator [Deinococcus cellulosilyticus NBRC 106333 = KACC 11606]|uniref:Transcriptional regulator n=2 Tax=Deinococcus cellulosilyticus TaxID=401558 RepID=A0A511N4M3_DEIC1|nr:transcriptional regulator [Deinococcus cellulosilyticus NBRC 106333 = KACC 11606]
MAGLHLLSKGGVQGLKIDTLCKHLQVTKGSFYHHFAHLNDYEQALLDFYEQVSTLDIIAHLQTIADPRARLRALVRQITTYEPAMEVSFRGWARVDDRARAVQERLDHTREQYVHDLILQIIPEQETATLLARGFYWLFVGSQQASFEHDRAEKARIHLLMLDRLGL